MTREEAKAYIIQHCIPNYPKMDKTEWDAAMGKAIEALRQPDPRSFSCGQENDMVSRQAAIDAIMGQPPEPHYPSWYAAQIEKLPAVQPATNCSEIPNGSDDTISRQAAIDAIDEQIEQCNKALGSFDISPKDEYAIKVERASLKAYKEQLENMPSAQPEQNGKWIYNSPMTMKCDRCGFAIKDWDWHRFKFCPNCGADMRGEQDEHIG